MTIEELSKYRNSLYESLSKELSSFEQNFLLVSGATFTFSITFIKDIVKISDSISLPVLFLSWLLIGSSVAIMMYTYLKIVNVDNELASIVNDFMKNKGLFASGATLHEQDAIQIKNDTDSLVFNSKRVLKKLRFSAVTCFLIGILCFSFFISVNLWRENHKEVNNSVDKSQPQNIDNESIMIIKDDTIKVLATDSLIQFKIQKKHG